MGTESGIRNVIIIYSIIAIALFASILDLPKVYYSVLKIVVFFSSLSMGVIFVFSRVSFFQTFLGGAFLVLTYFYNPIFTTAIKNDMVLWNLIAGVVYAIYVIHNAWFLVMVTLHPEMMATRILKKQNKEFLNLLREKGLSETEVKEAEKALIVDSDVIEKFFEEENESEE